MRRVLRIAGFGLVLVSFSIQSLGAESLAYIASPSAARQLMPAPAAILPHKTPPPIARALPPPKIVPPAMWGYYILAAAEIAVEAGANGLSEADRRWSALASSAKDFKGDAAQVAAELQSRMQSARKGLAATLTWKASSLDELIAPIDLPRPMPSVLARVPEPRPYAPPEDSPVFAVSGLSGREAHPPDLKPEWEPPKFADGPQPLAGPPESEPTEDRIEVIRSLRGVPAAPARVESVPTPAEHPLEIAQADFRSNVLESPTPVVVMFDTLRNCHCAEAELLQLRAQWHGDPNVVSLNAEDSPRLASEYGVKDHATLMLFKNGSLAKKEDADAMERRVMARHGGKFDSADMKAEIVRFARPAHKIQLYSTSWCHYCKLARQYLTEKGIAFEELDIEKDAQAKAQYDSYRMRGVPLAVIDGKPVSGFEPDAYAALLQD